MGVFLSSVTARGPTLIDRELYLSLGWIEGSARCRAAGIPETVRFQTKLEQAVRMLDLRARFRVTALIEYGIQGQYVAVCPRLGVLSLVSDSPLWFDWLASLTVFRFIWPAGRFSACRAWKHSQHTRSWAARRLFHEHDFWHYLGGH